MQLTQSETQLGTRAGLHDDVPDPTLRQGSHLLGGQLATTMADLKLKLSLSPKKWVACAAEVVTQYWTSVSASGLSCTRLANFPIPWQLLLLLCCVVVAFLI